ncbi:hypothetical protein NCS57_00935400 [Fusarium keratoplasticum]|uniref:Uncharacterized protein n=1 Tax=Fusarium keratoplasticum TaxID=1328300 RepID=A0ACC0QPS5_9HYPO|nr:hypothetical protein NCS57_00935400 [Fusarium keratoplasticum]KAI8663348.1 hypothetical protein NCS57_00935400 [Fusarium keratoplasticum]KAI8664036.1 hypothetical protein NCS55_00910500 [Fusarium keratoplasticum]
METVLVVGATSNIGVSAVKAALNTGRNVIAVVRNQASTSKLLKHVGTSKGITVAEADVTSPDGIKSVVQRVREGQLPSFQHVYSSVETFDLSPHITDVGTEALRRVMNVNLEANFFAFRATIPYLLEQKYGNSTWTLLTGAAGGSGWAGVTAISQGALFSLANVACRELADTNVRFNEVWLAFRVEHDEAAAKHGSIGSSAFAPHYEQILARPEISASRVRLAKPADISNFTWSKKLV